MQFNKLFLEIGLSPFILPVLRFCFHLRYPPLRLRGHVTKSLTQVPLKNNEKIVFEPKQTKMKN